MSDPRPRYEGGLGSSLAFLDDVNGDGRAEFAVGDQRGCCVAHDPEAVPRNEDSHPCRVVRFSGCDRTPIAAVAGDRDGDHFGATMVRIGDADGDGKCDLLVAAENRYVAVLSSRDLKEISRVHSWGRYSIRDSFGSSLASWQDQAGSGRPNFLVGADESLGGFFDHGYASVCTARGGRLLYNRFELRELGVDIANAGRLDGDAVLDVA